MQQDLEQQIRERAYQLWVAEGSCDGESDRHWLAAERELLAAFAATAPAPKQRAGRTAANSNVRPKQRRRLLRHAAAHHRPRPAATCAARRADRMRGEGNRTLYAVREMVVR